MSDHKSRDPRELVALVDRHEPNKLHWNDRKRLEAGKAYRDTPGRGNPIPVLIDPETTPPPQAPPVQSTFVELQPQDQIQELYELGARNSAGLQAVWEARDAKANFTKLAEKLFTIERDLAVLASRINTSINPDLSTVTKTAGASKEELIRIRGELDTMTDAIGRASSIAISASDRVALIEKIESAKTQQIATMGSQIQTASSDINKLKETEHDKSVSALAVQRAIKRRNKILIFVFGAAGGIVAFAKDIYELIFKH